MQISDFKNKKVLVMGLGLHGGGAATTKWLVRHGAKVTVTDLRTKKELAPSIKSLSESARKVRLILGKHLAPDFKQNDIIVVNPGVPRESKFLKIAKKHGARLENEASLFFRFCKNPIIAVTGTRGKTTTVNWIHHLLKTKYRKTVLTGNSSDNPMLNVLDKLDGKSPVVVELSSWQLELLPNSKRTPHIAVITNIYRDHLNRHRSIRDYAGTKANIFKNQTKKDFLVLNENNPWTRFFLRLKPKAKILYPSQKLNFAGNFQSKYGGHNVDNLSIAVLVARKMSVPITVIKKAIKNLPQVKYREEIIYQKGNIKVINDSTATSPDATIAALKRFAREGAIVLIAGGTDKNLEFSEWAKIVKKYVKPENLYLLNSSATKKMIIALNKIHYFKETKVQLFEDFKALLKNIKHKLPIPNYQFPITVLFSPGAASFEKFKNEFDRGLKFNLYWKSAT